MLLVLMIVEALVTPQSSIPYIANSLASKLTKFRIGSCCCCKLYKLLYSFG